MNDGYFRDACANVIHWLRHGSIVQRQATFEAGYSESRRESLCARCRGFMGLCGKKVCPILVKARTYLGLETLERQRHRRLRAARRLRGELRLPEGAGRPPDTAAVRRHHAHGLGGMAGQLVRRDPAEPVPAGPEQIGHRSPQRCGPSGMLEKIQELVLSDRPVDTEASFEKRPDMRVSFSMREAPTGPSADLKELLRHRQPLSATEGRPRGLRHRLSCGPGSRRAVRRRHQPAADHPSLLGRHARREGQPPPCARRPGASPRWTTSSASPWPTASNTIRP